MATTAPKKTPASPKPKKSATDRQFVTALSRGLAVLRCFDSQRPLLGTTEIAQLTRLPQPTVWRLCYTLQKLGYLMPAPHSDKLRVGLAIHGLGQTSLASMAIDELVRPEMAQIAKLTGVAVSLCVPEQDDVLIVQRAQGDGPLAVNLTIGSRLPIATSSGGWAYLATLSAPEREARLQRVKRQYDGRWTALRAAIERAIVDFESTGYILNDGHYHPEVLAVGAPSFDKSGTPVYLITCGGPSLKVKYMRDEVGPRIASLARKITVALSGRA